jgi:DNA-binding transcriptional MerR regulator
MADDLTIDELARRAGTRTSTVRLYQTKGLLPPPEIRGRVGYYSQAHLAGLRVIERLQKRGFSLAAIKDLLENWSQGASLSAILDPEQELAGFGEPTELSQADFAALFPDGHVDPEVVRRAGKLGLLAFDSDRGVIRIPSRAFLEIGRALAAHNVPPARSIAEFELLAKDARTIAKRFLSMFQEFVQAPSRTTRGRRSGGLDPSGDGATLEQVVERFRGMAATAISELVIHALNELAAAGTRTAKPSVDSDAG